MKTVGILVVAMVGLCGSIAFAKGPAKEAVTIVAHESSTTPYDWHRYGKVDVSCIPDGPCQGYFTPPASGTQEMLGAVLKLQRSDSSIIVAQCIAQKEKFSTWLERTNNWHNSAIYRNCRIPDTNSIVEAELYTDTVKLFWHAEGEKKLFCETYHLIGILEPASKP